jgi:hypothetical protein
VAARAARRRRPGDGARRCRSDPEQTLDTARPGVRQAAGVLEACGCRAGCHRRETARPGSCPWAEHRRGRAARPGNGPGMAEAQLLDLDILFEQRTTQSALGALQATALCNAGEEVVAGGYEILGLGTLRLKVNASRPTTQGDREGWFVKLEQFDPQPSPGCLVARQPCLAVYAICTLGLL